MLLKDQVEGFREEALAFLQQRGKTLEDVTLGVQAWNIAWACNKFTLRCYDLGANDAHIQTLLKKVFPKAVFGK